MRARLSPSFGSLRCAAEAARTASNIGVRTKLALVGLVTLFVARAPTAGVPRTVTAQEPAHWPVAGSVVLSGGALAAVTTDTFVRKIIGLAGGSDAHIVVIPTANPGADPAALRKVFETRGAHDVVVVNTLDHTVANSPDFVKPLRAATAVFLTGGQPTVLEQAYVGTAVEREIKAVLARGGVLAGDSAGATAIGCAFLTWLPDAFGKRGDELCALPRVAVSPHANAARGYVTDTEVLGYLRLHPEAIGIDIDENTVVVLRGSHAEVFGAGTVAFIDPAKSATGPRLAFGTASSPT